MKQGLIIIAVIASLGLVGYGAYSLTKPQSNSTPTSSSNTSTTASSSASPTVSASSGSSTSTTITTSELAKNNGKNGAKCWVAVNGKVYDVSNDRSWRNGEHIPSEGQAKCGRDETSTIGQSPHGTSVLAQLPVVGMLAQ